MSLGRIWLVQLFSQSFPCSRLSAVTLRAHRTGTVYMTMGESTLSKSAACVSNWAGFHRISSGHHFKLTNYRFCSTHSLKMYKSPFQMHITLYHILYFPFYEVFCTAIRESGQATSQKTKIGNVCFNLLEP